MNRSNKGITLIALVVTIIVLLILAGISISMISGQNGILTKAGEAKTRTDFEQIKEELGLAITSASLDYYNEGKTGTLRDYLFSSEGQAKIKSELGTNDITFNSSNHTITYKGIVFTIAEDGTIKSGIEVAEVNPDNLEAEELPADFWIASEGVAYINTKYIEWPEEYGDYGMYYGSYGYYGSNNSFGYIPLPGECQYTRISVPSTVDGEVVTEFNVQNVNNIVYIEIQEGIQEIPELYATKDTIKIIKVQKTTGITESDLREKLTYEFGSTNYTIENSNDNLFYIVKIKEYKTVSEEETESRAVVLTIQSTMENVTTIECNGQSEELVDNKAEFIMTKNGDYQIIGKNAEGEIVGESTCYATKCKIEEYSNIQNSNYTLTQGGLTAVVPAGFAYGTSSNVGTISTGLVITDAVDNGYSIGNEFVWIPVNKDDLTVGNTNKKIAVLQDGSTTDYIGVLYDWERDSTGNTVITQTASSRREPLQDDNESGILMQSDYNAFIESIKKYGGFYIGRYEMGLENNYSKLGVLPANAGRQETSGWNGLYSRAKSYNKTGVTSQMIWGSQFDAMLNFALTNDADKQKVTSTIGNHENPLKTGIWIGPDNLTDKINNIFDLEGNYLEWTQEYGEGRYAYRGWGFVNFWPKAPCIRNGSIYMRTELLCLMLILHICLYT